MQLAFERDEQRRRIIGRFCLGEAYQGAPGFLHGGILALLLDEAMGKLNRFRDRHAVTAELTVDYLRPVRVGQKLVVEAAEEGQDGPLLLPRAEIRDAQGVVLAHGRGRFLAFAPGRYAARLGVGASEA